MVTERGDQPASTPRSRAKRSLGILGALALVASLAACKTAQTEADCLARPTVATIAGPQVLRLRPHTLQLGEDATIDARTAVWDAPLDPEAFVRSEFPATIEGPGGLCLVGGRIVQPWDHETTDWFTWHGPTAITTKIPRSVFVQTELENVGDGFRFANNSDQWKLQGVTVTRAHDDCVQNDAMFNGKIDDSFFDGCYVFFSARGSDNATFNGSGNLVTISDSLIRMEVMPFDHNGIAGHGPIFKMASGRPGGGGISNRFAIRDTVIRIDQRPTTGGTVGIPSYDHDGNPATPDRPYLDESKCSNNVLVWTGPTSGQGAMTAEEIASYPSSCWTITSDTGVWDAAVADWQASRP
jgi:hypothetical protein